MKKIKTWMPLVAIAAAGATMLPVVSLTSCHNVKTVEVKTPDEFRSALADETVGAIKVSDYINLNDEKGEYAVEINRDLKIFCGRENGELWRTIQNENFSRSGLIRITNPHPDKPMNVTIENIGLRLWSNVFSTIISLNNAENVTLNLNGVIATTDRGEGQYVRGDVLKIEENTASDQCKININDSTLEGWAAIYNKGSNVKLKANNSEFVGTNDYDPQGPECVFATIIMADYPISLDGVNVNRSFSANNDFTFNDCELQAADGWTSQVEKHEWQFIFECRSPANNKLHIDEKSLAKIDYYYEAEMKDLFVTAVKNFADITTPNIEKYLKSDLGKENLDVPVDIKDVATYYDYYESHNAYSQIYINGTAYEDYKPTKHPEYKDYFKKTALNANRHYDGVDPE